MAQFGAIPARRLRVRGRQALIPALAGAEPEVVFCCCAGPATALCARRIVALRVVGGGARLVARVGVVLAVGGTQAPWGLRG